LREELRAVAPFLEERRHFRAGALHYEKAKLRGVEVVVTRTGIGKRNAALRVAELLAQVKLAQVVVTGFAGALSRELASGDVLVAAEVQEASCGAVWPSPQCLLDLALHLPIDAPPLKVGRLLTAETVVSRPEEKRALGEALEAQAVDMESSAVVREAALRGVPALCARAILDEVDYELPFAFGKILTPEGKLRPFGALAAVARQPLGLFKLEGLRARARRASASLAAFVPALVEAMARGV
jgi:adenosylhomocysteine nucleosidase